MSRKILLSSVVIALVTTNHASAVPTVDPNLLNAVTNVIADGDDPPGLSGGFSVTSSVGDDPEGAFGNAGGLDALVESTTFIFGNGRTVDNGNGVFGDGGESTDTITWSTSSPVILYGYRSNVADDGGNGQRATQLVQFSVEGEVDDLFDNNNANGATDRLFSIPQVGDSLQYGVTHNDPAGARIVEIDAITNSTAGAVVDPNIWNATTNSGGDQPAGLSFNIVASSVVSGTDTVEDAFGNNNGAIESDNFIFGDAGNNDNGDNLFGTGDETVDFITWQTTSLLQLGGYQVTVLGDGGVNAPEGAPRSTELMRLLVEGNVVSTIDLNAHTSTYLLLFDSGPVIGDDFRIEFTRANGSPRIFEIDAVNAIIVPEPVSASLATIAALVMVRFTRKRR